MIFFRIRQVSGVNLFLLKARRAHQRVDDDRPQGRQLHLVVENVTDRVGDAHAGYRMNPELRIQVAAYRDLAKGGAAERRRVPRGRSVEVMVGGS